jgi:hypothetical protein
VLYLYLGLRPGGSTPVLAYTYGPLVLGVASALGLCSAFVWCLLRRPVLQRARAAPLTVLAATLWWCSFPLPYPSSHARESSSVRFRLPFDGEWTVRGGGERRETNPFLLDPSRRFALSFEPPPGADSLARRVLAPASGGVVSRETDVARRGARLVLAVAPGEFFVIEGLEHAALAPEDGAELASGAPLGVSAGVLTVFLQDGPRVGRAEGIPFRFHDYLADGRRVDARLPEPAQRVRSVAPAPER